MKIIPLVTSKSAFLAALLGPLSLQAANIAWDNSGTDFNAGASWVDDVAPGTGDRAVFGTAAVIQPNLTGALTIQGLSFNIGGYTLTSGGPALTLTTTGAGGNEAASAIYSVASATNTISAPIILGGAAGTTQSFRNNGDGAHVTFNGAISSANAITGLNLTGGNGTFTFNTANTYNGTTTLAGSSRIAIGHAQALSAGALQLNNSSGGLQASINLIGANKLNNNIVLQSSEVFLFDSGANAIQFGGSVDLNGGTGTAKLIKSQISGGATFDGVISNDNGRGLAFQLANNSNVTLNAVNTYTGNTTIRGAGTVRVSNIGNANVAGNLGAGTTIHMGVGSAAGKLVYTGAGESTSKAINLNGTAGGAAIEHAGTGTLAFTANVTATENGNKTLTLEGSTSGVGRISGDIGNPNTGAISLTKAGTGTWILAGNNTYTGATAVNAGTLLIEGSLGNTAVTVSTAGTLGGNGTILGATTINSGGTLSPGNSPGLLTFEGNLTLNNGSTYLFESGDLVDVNGTLDLNPTWTLALVGNENTFQAGGSTILFTYSLLAPTPYLTPTFDLAGLSGLSITPGDLSVTNDAVNGLIILNGISVIPEPSVSILLGVAGMAGLFFRRRTFR